INIVQGLAAKSGIGLSEMVKNILEHGRECARFSKASLVRVSAAWSGVMSSRRASHPLRHDHNGVGWCSRHLRVQLEIGEGGAGVVVKSVIETHQMYGLIGIEVFRDTHHGIRRRMITGAVLEPELIDIARSSHAALARLRRSVVLARRQWSFVALA